MNKSTLEKQTGLRAGKSCNVFFLGDCLNDSFTVKAYSNPKGWQSLFDKWWSKRRAEVFERDRYMCVQCKSTRSIECDHIRNRSQGGTSSMDNLQSLCRDCHYKKTNNKD